LKNLLEFIPLLIFFFVFKTSGIIAATLSLVISSMLAFLIVTICYKKLAIMPLISAIILGFFGFLTWYLQDPFFIKIKPTIVNSLFASILFISYLLKKPVLQFLLGNIFIMPKDAWLTLTIRFTLFFFFLALLNEIIWRNFSLEFWVNFKVFGFLPITLIFTISQMPFMMRYQSTGTEKK
jgi:intracellular septation protein